MSRSRRFRTRVALPNVVPTPHIGGVMAQAQAALQSLVLRTLAAFFAGQPVVSPVARART